MAYFIFTKVGGLYKIAENQSDLNVVNIEKSLYDIIEVSSQEFQDVRLGKKAIVNYSNGQVNYVQPIIGEDGQSHSFKTTILNKEDLKSYISNIIDILTRFNNYNPNHPSLSKLNNYKDELMKINVNNLSYPINSSLEEYLESQGIQSISPLQIP